MQPGTIIHTCPDCSRVIYFSGPETNMIVCASCGATLLKNEAGTLIAKPVFKTGNEITLIQPGTTGMWKEKPFTISGRFRIWFEESVISYWTVLFNNGTMALLEEGYGMYNMLLPCETPSTISFSRLDSINIGGKLEAGNNKYYIAEKKLYPLRYELEGEAYLPHPTQQLQLMQCSSPDSNTYLLFNYKQNGIYTFGLAPSSPEALQLKNLRSFTYSTHTVKCINCSSPITIKTFPQAQSCACMNCGYCYELDNGSDFRRISERFEPGQNCIYLPIGNKGKLFGTEYEVLGFTCKEELNEYKAQWHEYVLFNPEDGYAFLSEYQGHWIFIKERTDSPVLNAGDDKDYYCNYFDYRKKTFHIFNHYKAKVVDAAGEFPYNIFNNSNIIANEFIAPPEMWIMERSNREGITWYHGRHINHNVLRKAFGVMDMPYKTGVGAVSPRGSLSVIKILMAGVAGCILLFLLHTFTSTLQQNRELLNQEMRFPDTADKVLLVTPKFEFNKTSSNVLLQADAPVMNNWVEVAATLVNANTGKEYSREQGIEYYEGYSEGEHWTEGSRHENIWFRKVPSGTYFLQLEGTRESTRQVSAIQLKANYDVPSDRNVYIACILLGIFCVIHLINTLIVHNARWRNSPFSQQDNNNEE